MPDKLKIAVNWAAACGGCDVSLLDIEDRILELAAIADIVYWPVAMDFKRSDLLAFGPGEIDVGIFNGAIRTAEHAEDARILRERCKVLIAYGACAAFGGIPGLGNLYSADEILNCAYCETASSDNPDGVLPSTDSTSDHGTLELPAFEPWVRFLAAVVPVDVVVPGCPPPMERVLDAVAAIAELARSGTVPEPGTVLASDTALCDECPRLETRTGRTLPRMHRPHQVMADPEVCFLEQGILCLGLATRGGCGATCIGVNTACRGCFGPVPEALDPGAEALSAIGSVVALANEDDQLPGKRLAAVRSIPDLAGTFYRFTLPSAKLSRRVDDRPEE